MIDRQEVMRIARLARLELSEAEIAQYQQDLTGFLTSGAKLQQVDVSKLEGTSHAVAITHELREDQVGTSLDQREVLAMGPAISNGFFKVPRIVEEQE